MRLPSPVQWPLRFQAILGAAGRKNKLEGGIAEAIGKRLSFSGGQNMRV